MNTEDLKNKAEAVFDKKTYEEAILKLTHEKDKLEHELIKEYRNARHYVRKHPEQGVGFSFLGGLLIGFIVAKLLED
jgi:ElaB/YqjD/DUF883 family membrane-anchored ribosome-binding protein